jgi:hypothetical protein
LLALLVAGCGPQLPVPKLIGRDNQIVGGLQLAGGQAFYVTEVAGDVLSGRIRAVPLPSGSPHNVAATLYTASALAVDGQYVYYPDVPGIERADAAGATDPAVISQAPIFLDGTESAVTSWPMHGRAIYCFGGLTGQAGAALWRVPTDGSPASPLPGWVDGAGSQQHGPVADGGYLYWANDDGPSQPAAIVRSAVDGSGAQVLANEIGARTIAASQGYVWWATASEIVTLTPDGKLFHNPLDTPVTSMVAYQGSLYLSRGTVDGRIERLDPGGQPELLALQTNPGAIAVGEGLVAWVQAGLSIRALALAP